MTGEAALERRYRRLLAWYPASPICGRNRTGSLPSSSSRRWPWSLPVSCWRSRRRDPIARRLS